MKVWDLTSLITYNLVRRRGRVILTGLGVVIGTAAVMIMVSLSSGLQRGATSQFGRLSDLKRIEVYPSYGMMGMGMASSEQQRATLLLHQITSEIAKIPGVEQVVMSDNLKGNYTISYGRLMTFANVSGVGTKDLQVFEYPLLDGTTKLEAGTAVIGGWAAKNFVNPDAQPGMPPPEQPDLLGQSLRLLLTKQNSEGNEVRKTINLRIVGVLVESRSSADGNLFVRMEDVTGWNEWFLGKRINRNKDGYDSMVVKVSDVKDATEITKKITDMGLMAFSPQTIVQEINSFFIVLQIFFGGIGAVSLLVAAIGIANTMTMSILERTAEIGLIKAIGASDSDVLEIFLGEASGIGFFGGLGGILVGWLGGEMLNITALVFFANRALKGGGPPPDVVVYTPLWLPIVVLILATVVGTLSGYFPAKRAMHLPPVQALKHE